MFVYCMYSFLLKEPGQSQEGGGDKESGERGEEEGVEMPEDFDGALEDVEEDKDADGSQQSGGSFAARQNIEEHTCIHDEVE